ncbi:hypothetical protein [uncultured Desulfobulbus sp.]|uniref:hypothetical protein n=1 Tax=uncultured Desulfobulbus sp. TaxID=239745 RepID=UPI0029C7A6CB|nr:hypothetical protein [uncultured Desulfobulbus sp.]
MFNNDKGRSLVILLIFVLVLCAAIGISRLSAVSAQDENAGMPGMMPGGMPGMPGMGGMPGQGMMMPGMMPGMGQMGGSSSIAISEGFVYVVHGGQLSMFNSKTLKLVKSVDLGNQDGMRGMGGMGGRQGNMPQRMNK